MNMDFTYYLPAGNYKTLVSYIGFQTFLQIALFDNKKLDIDLNVDGEVLKEVIITDKIQQ
jgi:hypothetical protein